MRTILLIAAFLGALCASASAQCVAVGGINSVPQVDIACRSEPTVDTYGATSVALVPVASATDLACLTGSATRVVRLQHIRVSGSSGTLVNVPVFITKHASANTGGTAATTTALPVPYPLDSTDATVSATTTAYTANPTITDAAPGIIDNDIAAMSTTGTATTGGAILFDYSVRNYSEAPTLRGIAQQLCVNVNGLTISTGLINISFRWTEATQ